jgi:digeranylgeranylglycerophospholipid reductase
MEFDAIVAGAGPAGSLAARELAAAGLKVGLFDAEDRDRLCKTIVVEAEQEMFSTVKVRPPEGDEVPYRCSRFRVFSPRGREVFVLSDHPSSGLFLNRFARRLLAEAEAAGASFFGDLRAVAPIVSGGTVTGAVFEQGGHDEEVKARLVIDATGHAAALTRKLCPELGIEFPEELSDLVLAENHFHAIDADWARDAVRQQLAADEEVWNRLGVYGNYSTEYSHLSLANGRAYVLIGHQADYPNPPMRELMERFRAGQGYFKEEVFGGGGAIRVRRSLDRLVGDGFMAVGEAADTVIPMHGSGVSSALYTGWLAGRVAAAALARGRTDTAALWPYAAEYQRGRGAVLAGQDASRRVLGALGRERLTALMESGAMQAEDAASALAARAPSISMATLPSRLKGLALHPGLVPPLVRMGRAVSAAMKLYARYPESYDAGTFARWQGEAERVFSRL